MRRSIRQNIRNGSDVGGPIRTLAEQLACCSAAFSRADMTVERSLTLARYKFDRFEDLMTVR